MGHPYRRADGNPYPIDQDADTAMCAIEESLAIEERIRKAARSHLGYEGDPTLEPSPFFTTLDGYRRLFIA